MSYQVLARKWRPTNFKQLVGQEHVLQALVHALESQRLHHAYLFTGTRGVGKTTIARILARCLSCNKGITSEPCGTCGACTSIEQGRYVDLIEIDAASRTKVEDMRELLENVQYAPTEGRFKIYLIDEVHMLSSHSFNALLKTLEEPPEHVKFLFATTDPQKLPITILSRCLQFNLKNMTPEKIVDHLKYVLSQEQVSAEEAALWALARGADGSMRDALSLTDQAIAYTQGKLEETPVSAMLGTVDQKKVYRLLDTLVARDAKALLQVVAGLAEFSPDYASVLEVIVSVFHRVAMEQAVPGVTDNSQGDQERVSFYASNLTAEDVQLYYQIALVARKDLAISPDARAGFEMALLRMMAFCMSPPTSKPEPLAPAVEAHHHSDSTPAQVQEMDAVAPNEGAQMIDSSAAHASHQADASAFAIQSSHEQAGEPDYAMTEPRGLEVGALPEDQAGSPLEHPAALQDSALQNSSVQSSSVQSSNVDSSNVDSSNVESSGVQSAENSAEPEATQKKTFESVANSGDLAPTTLDATPDSDADLAKASAQTQPSEPSYVAQLTDQKANQSAGDSESSESSSEVAVSQSDVEHANVDLSSLSWSRQALRLGLTGMTQNMLMNMIKVIEGDTLRMFVETGHFRLFNNTHKRKITQALKDVLGWEGDIDFVDGLIPDQETPAMWRERMREERLIETKQSLLADPNIQQLIAEFDGRMLDESVVVLGTIE